MKTESPQCIRCEESAYSWSFELKAGYCEKCAEKILAGALLLDVAKKSKKKSK